MYFLFVHDLKMKMSKLQFTSTRQASRHFYIPKNLFDSEYIVCSQKHTQETVISKLQGFVQISKKVDRFFTRKKRLFPLRLKSASMKNSISYTPTDSDTMEESNAQNT